jgi:hypothetical protein
MHMLKGLGVDYHCCDDCKDGVDVGDDCDLDNAYLRVGIVGEASAAGPRAEKQRLRASRYCATDRWGCSPSCCLPYTKKGLKKYCPSS